MRKLFIFSVVCVSLVGCTPNSSPSVSPSPLVTPNITNSPTLSPSPSAVATKKATSRPSVSLAARTNAPAATQKANTNTSSNTSTTTLTPAPTSAVVVTATPVPTASPAPQYLILSKTSVNATVIRNSPINAGVNGMMYGDDGFTIDTNQSGMRWQAVQTSGDVFILCSMSYNGNLVVAGRPVRLNGCIDQNSNPDGTYNATYKIQYDQGGVGIWHDWTNVSVTVTLKS